MSNLDEVRQNIVGKFERALWNSEGERTVLPFVKLALLDQQVAFEAILLQRQAAQQVEKPVDRRIYERCLGQIERINDWLAQNQNGDQDLDADCDTAEAMVKAANRLAAQLAQVRTELALVNGSGSDLGIVPSPSNGIDWSGLSEKAQDWRIGLDKTRWKYSQVPRPIRLELFRCVCAHLEGQLGRAPMQSEFDAARPGWMSSSTSHTQTLGQAWTALIDRTIEIEVAP